MVDIPASHPHVAGESPWTPDVGGAGCLVAILAPADDPRGWAAGVALDIASSWGDEGHRVVLADGALDQASLHREAGLDNAEGLSDAAFFGASVSRVAQPVPGRTLFLITAGSPVGDGAAVARSPRWGRIVEGFREAGVVLAVFVREGEASAEPFLESATDIVVLEAAAGGPPEVPDTVADRVRARVTPGTGVGPDEAGEAAGEPEATIESLDGSGVTIDAEAGSGPASETEPSVMAADAGPASETDPAVGEAPAAGMDATAAAGAPVTAQAAADAVSRPGPARAREGARGGRRPGGRRTLLWVALGILVIVLIVILGASRPG